MDVFISCQENNIFKKMRTHSPLPYIRSQVQVESS